MGGLGPGIGGLEYLVIGVVALLVLGPERLPVVLRKLGKMIGKARGMANEFRSSFDEMARQSELDDLRQEVEALRTGQGAVNLGAEADAAFKDIKAELERPIDTPAPVMTPAPSEWPDGEPVMMPVSAPPLTSVGSDQGEPVAARSPAKRVRKPASAKAKAAAKAKATATSPAKAKPRARAATKAKALATKPRAPRNSKLDL